MKICLVLLALLVAVAYGHNKDGASYAAKKAIKLSLKESFIEKIHNIKDKIHAKISSKKATKAAKKAQKHSSLIRKLEKGAQLAADCSTVMDEVWEEQCETKYEPSCRMEMQPDCTSIQAKECAPEAQTRCSFVFEDKCKTISIPKCTIDWEKRCTSIPDCTTIEAKSCTEVEKDVCVTHFDKTCTTSTVNVCRKVAIRELTPVVDTVERTGLKASIAAHKAHKALKKGKLVSKAGRLHKRDAEASRVEPFEVEEPKIAKPTVENPQEPFAPHETVSLKKRSLDDQDCQRPNFLCDDGRQCVDFDKICDGYFDCIDLTDEENEPCKAQKKKRKEVEEDVDYYGALVEDAEEDDPVVTTPATVIMPEENCNATCLKAREFVNCETDKAKAEIEQAKKMTRNRQAQDQACAGIKESECNKEANEWLYPTVPKDVGSYFNCSQYLPEKGPAELLKEREEELIYVRKQLETCKRLHFDGKANSTDASLNSTDVFLPGEQVSRNTRSLKGDTAGDQTTNLAAKSSHPSKETFKAGFKAAKDRYHEAKAHFKATTKALIHAKFNKGSKASKGEKAHHVKAAVPTLRVRYQKTCQDEPREICTQTPRQECHKEVVPLCKFEPRETCVAKEKCKSWPKKNCGMVHKETCLPFPTKKCTEISTPVCRIVPRQECTEKKHEICETVPTKDCQKVRVSKPRTVCIPRPTSRTIEDW